MSRLARATTAGTDRGPRGPRPGVPSMADARHCPPGRRGASVRRCRPTIGWRPVARMEWLPRRTVLISRDRSHPPLLRGPDARRSPLLPCLVLLGLIGCTSIGPPTLRRDRLDYADAMADASKRETLMNIVKLRYGDTPSMVTVNQLVAGYTLEGRVDLGSGLPHQHLRPLGRRQLRHRRDLQRSPDGHLHADQGRRFRPGHAEPDSAERAVRDARGRERPADLTLGLGVQSINGLSNWTADARGDHARRCRFAEVLELLGELRSDGVLGFRFDTQTGPRTVYLLLEGPEGQPLDPRARRLLELLGLDPDLRSFPIRFGFGEGRAAEIRIYTRSLIEIPRNSRGPGRGAGEGDVAAGAGPTPPGTGPAELPSLPHLAVMSGPRTSGRSSREPSSPGDIAAPGTGSTIAISARSASSAP